jgi:PAS domain S-box-containing protein
MSRLINHPQDTHNGHTAKALTPLGHLTAAWVVLGLAFGWLGWIAYTAYHPNIPRTILLLVVASSWTLSLLLGCRGLHRWQQWSRHLQAQLDEHQQTEAALREREAYFCELFENASDLIYTLDMGRHITSANKAFERLTGYSHDELIQMKIADIVAPEYLGRSWEMRSKKTSGTSWTTYELALIGKGGQHISIETSSRLIFKEDDIVGIQGIARDITARKQAEMALQQANNELERRVE